MPRNPNKTHCTMPGCRNWAMRGQTRCRAHKAGAMHLADRRSALHLAQHPRSIAEIPSCEGSEQSVEPDATRDWREAETPRETRGEPRGVAEQGNGTAARGPGAPPGNLNALKHGCHSHPLPLPDLERLATAAISGEPGDFARQIDLAVRAIQARTGWSDASGDPFLTLVALRRLLTQLAALVAGNLFDVELQAATELLPAPTRAYLHGRITRHAALLEPEARLLLLRKIKNRKKQSAEPEPEPELA